MCMFALGWNELKNIEPEVIFARKLCLWCQVYDGKMKHFIEACKYIPIIVMNVNLWPPSELQET